MRFALCSGMTTSSKGLPKMSLLDHPFDPVREAALVTGAGNGIGRAIAQAWSASACARVFAM